MSLTSKVDPIVWWYRLSRFPGGARFFSKVLSWVVPYTGTISPRITFIGFGQSRVYMKNTRKVRNHLGTVHAVAMTNLVELAASLALLSRPEKIDCAVIGVSTKYFKPARGEWICATCTTANLALNKKDTAQVLIYSDGHVVAEGTCTWRIWK